MSAMRRGEVGVLLSATSLSKAYKELLPSNRQFKKKKKAWSQICWHTSLANAGCISHSILQALVSSLW